MKVHITYDPEEAEKAAAIYAAVFSMLPGSRIHTKDGPNGRKHVYLTEKTG